MKTLLIRSSASELWAEYDRLVIILAPHVYFDAREVPRTELTLRFLLAKVAQALAAWWLRSLTLSAISLG